MKIREYQNKDLNTVIELFYNSVHSNCKKDYTTEQLEAWAPRDMDVYRFETSLEKNHTLVIEDNSEIIAFGDMGDTGYLDRLYVREDYLGKGLGKILLERFEKYARNLGVRYVTTAASITSLNFFKKMGYVVIREEAVERRGVRLKRIFMEKEL